MKIKFDKIFGKVFPKFKNRQYNQKQSGNFNTSHQYEKTDFKEELKKYLSHMETKSMSQDYQGIMKFLYSQDRIVHKSAETTRKNKNEKTEAENKVLENLEKESDRCKSSFFNNYSLKLLENTNANHLVSIACKSYVGDTDVPQDTERSFIILQMAKSLCKNSEEMKETQFFLDYFRKNSATSMEEKNEASMNIFKDKGYIKSKYVASRELFKIITYNLMGLAVENPISRDEKEFLYMKIYNVMEEAAADGIYEAYYFLGLMNLHGYYTKVNTKKAFYYFCIAASYSHALANYELYKMIKDGTVKMYGDEEEKLRRGAMYDYLRTAAEEGYVEAMHELGNNYISGHWSKRDKLKALAWHRQACRNGYILSYEPCGDLYYTGGDGIKASKSLSLIMYYCAYVKGITDLKEKILKVREELVNRGEPIPEMVLV